ncbi:FAD-dependent oxidoreductase [Rhodopila sp.]|uniref:FAD-dependent oxidoreductase n=1 Tax=Rhodopila sp. TaxID=2480087 RepID=UPI003D0992EB
MSSADFDYFVIGGGSGGVRSARVAAQHGARVGIAESRRWGGTCVNVGCVPKKLLTMAEGYAATLRDASALGWDFEDAAHDWAALIAAQDAEIARLNDVYTSLLCQAGCTIFNQQATPVDAHTIALNRRNVTADRILIATGGRPVVPGYADLGPDLRNAIFTSDEAFHLQHMPIRVVIIGGGYIAAELPESFTVWAPKFR